MESIARKVKRRGVDPHISYQIYLTLPRVERNIVRASLEGQVIGPALEALLVPRRPTRLGGVRSFVRKRGRIVRASTRRDRGREGERDRDRASRVVTQSLAHASWRQGACPSKFGLVGCDSVTGALGTNSPFGKST